MIRTLKEISCTRKRNRSLPNSSARLVTFAAVSPSDCSNEDFSLLSSWTFISRSELDWWEVSSKLVSSWFFSVSSVCSWLTKKREKKSIKKSINIDIETQKSKVYNLNSYIWQQHLYEQHAIVHIWQPNSRDLKKKVREEMKN